MPTGVVEGQLPAEMEESTAIAHSKLDLKLGEGEPIPTMPPQKTTEWGVE